MHKLILIKLIFFIKFLNWFLKLTGKGSGTALPGLIIEKYFPWVTELMLSQIPNSIIITGTNGKTTTQSLLTNILKSKGIKVINNKAGSNMTRGIVSELLRRASWNGKLNFEYAIYEVEEATFPKIVEFIKPKVIVITNLFRDQLDAYGEIDRTQKFLIEGIRKSPQAKIVLNFDDPKVREIQTQIDNEFIWVKLMDEFVKTIKFETGINEITEAGKNKDVITAKNCSFTPEGGNSFDVEILQNKSRFLLSGLKLEIPGRYQVYNALSAIAAARLIALDIPTIRQGISSFQAAFGRGETITIKRSTKTIYFKILLVKNPVGCNLNLDLVKDVKNLNLWLLLNDNTADGKDVSWIWDCNFEVINHMDLKYFFYSGKRARDLQLRTKYALNSQKSKNTPQYLNSNIKQTLDIIAQKLNTNEIVYVLPTYTAMLELRKILGKKL